MTPTSPVLAPEYVDKEVVYAKDQPEYIPLPTLRNINGVVLSRWRLTDAERQALINGADVMLSIHTFNQPLQPILIEVLEGCETPLTIATRMGLMG